MSPKILIVDDEPNLLRMIGYALHIEGYRIVAAGDGRTALKKVLSDRPDLIILDVMLPDMTGVEICQWLRSKPETADLPIIMLSARVQVSDKVRGLQAGADEYVTKPVDPEEMVARVGALLARTRRLHQLQSARKRGKIIGFIGAKGGVGTTTVALNVALTLVKHKKKVAAVELRSYFGTFPIQLGRTPVDNLRALLELPPQKISDQALSKQLVRHATGLRILFGLQGINGYKEIKPGQVQAIAKGLARFADYTIIDLPYHPSPANRAALQLCDFVIMVTEPEPTSMTSAKVTLALLRAWGIGEEMVGLAIVNRVRYGTSMKLTQIKSELGYRIVGSIPPDPDLCKRSLELGSALVVCQPDSTVAGAIDKLAGRLATERVQALAV